MKSKRIWGLVLMATAMTVQAQQRLDSLRMRVGYSSDNQVTMAGAIDKMTRERNKSLFQGEDGDEPVDESDGHTTVFPIPADVRALNQNLTQNQGY